MAEPTLLIDKIIKKIEYLFLCMGINIKVAKKTRIDHYRSWFIYILNFIWLNTDVLGAVLWFLTGVAEHKSFTELTYVSPCITLSFLSDFKTFYLFTNKTKSDLLIERIRQLEINQMARAKDSETANIIKTEDNYLNRAIRILNILNFVLIICFALTPITLVLLKYYMSDEVELILPFLVVYPFDPYDIRFYPWVYLRQIWSETIVVLGNGAVDFMFYIFCTYLRMQFRLLRHYIERVIPKDYKREILCDSQGIQLKLVDLIKWHQELISCVALLESMYTRSMLFNFVASSVIICLTGFNVTAIDDTAYVLTFLSFLLMSLLQIFFLCFFGNLLMESSMAVSDGIYNSRWYSADTALGKTLLVVLTRAQSPSKLTASNYADVNLRAFMKICSTAWSYFALLQTLYTGPQE